ncbi:MAG TPA: AI-2E family transporter [Verrucomicrobiae bacterium]|nr:AI-2E family transporter [Verrucomicrobiae bacterium]
MSIWRSTRFWRIGLFSLVGITLLSLTWLARAVLIPFLIAFLLAYLFSPAVKFLTQRKFSRGISIALVFTIFFLSIGTLIFYGIPELFGELNNLAESLPVYAGDVQRFFTDFQAQYKHSGLPPGIVRTIDANLVAGEEWLTVKLQNLISWILSLVGSLPLLVLAPVLAIYMLLDWERFKQGLTGSLPHKWRPGAIHLGQELNFVFRKFIRGHLTVAALVGILVGLGMKLIGMDYALLIGVISGLFDLIPYFGPVIGAVPALSLALLKSPGMALWVLAVIFIVQQLESNVIHPKIVGDSIGLHPLVIVFVLLAGGKLFGFWGMLLAVPAAGMIKVLLTYLYLKLV